MYAHFYQLSENPFNLTPDPKFHYVNASTREAMASILHGIKARKGFITLIGEAGTGKTTLLKRILDEIEGETQIVFVFNPGVSFDELLEFICMELGVAADGGRRLQLLDKLNAYLLEQLTVGRNVVVMIDEAQTLDAAVLEELRLLSNLETSKEKILQILLSGQPELEDKLRKPNLRQLRQRIAVRATLTPMRPEEIGPYVETRLRSAGADRPDLFTPPALRKAWRASKGIPRVANVICDNAMMIAFAEGKRRITTRVMAEAIRDLYSQGDGATWEAVRGWLATPALRYAVGVIAGLALALPVALALAPKSASPPGKASAQQPAPQRPDVATAPPPAPVKGEGIVAPVPGGASQEAEAAADRAVETSPPASGVDVPVSDSIRDSMRRAEVVARSTAARLYPPSEPSAEQAEPVAAKPEERLVDLGASKDTLGQPSSKLDDSALIRSLGPLEGGEAAAFGPGAGPAKQEMGETTRSEPAPVVDAKQTDRGTERPVSPGVAHDQKTALGNLKPVKAGTVTVGSEVAEPANTPSRPAAGGSVAAAGEADKISAESSVAAATARADEARISASMVARAASPQPGADVVAAAPKTPTAQPEVAALEPETFRTLGPNASEPIVGQLVRVSSGDTLWDIAVTYYGTAGPATLKRILNGNPGIRDPRQLDAGSHIYLPWQRPDQMVSEEANGTFSVVIAVAPLESRLGPARRWVESLGADGDLTIAAFNGAERSFRLRLVGLPSREAALTVAADLLERQASSR